jgi:hypothetical protein
VTELDDGGKEHEQDVPVGVRVSASSVLLHAAISWREQVEPDQRVTAIETAINTRNGLRVVRSRAGRGAG